MGYLPDSEQNIREHPVPVAPILRGHSTEHPFQGLVESFHQPIGLRVVHGGAELFDLQEATEVCHGPGHERRTLVGQYLGWDADPATQEEQLLGNGL